MEKYMSMRDATSPIEQAINCGCRTNKEGVFVDLLNKEIEELQKATKEMASDMDYACTSKDLYPSDAKEIAKTLYLLNYRKIDKDSVVLSNEEYGYLKSIEKLYDPFWFCAFGGCEGARKECKDTCEMSIFVKERKETAEKILNIIDIEIEKGMEHCKDDYRGLLTARVLIQLFCKEQFSTEIKE